MLGPVLKRRQVLVIHDTSTKAMPEAFSKTFVAAYDFIIPNAARMADLVVSVSDFSRREMQKYYGLDPTKIPICYEGSDHILRHAPDNTILDKLNLKPGQYFLGVGIYALNKNLNGTLAALKKTGLKGVPLVATGKRRLDVHNKLAAVHDDNLVDTGHITDNELRALYDNALATGLSSTYEGFGLPPLEAMQCGCPAIVSDHDVLVEIGGDATLRCGVNDIDSLAAAMKAVYSDPALARKTESRRPQTRAALYLGQDRAHPARSLPWGWRAALQPDPTGFFALLLGKSATCRRLCLGSWRRGTFRDRSPLMQAPPSSATRRWMGPQRFNVGIFFQEENGRSGGIRTHDP